MRQQVFPTRGSRGISPVIEETVCFVRRALNFPEEDYAEHRTIDPEYERSE
jgi:hypothetical protein